MKLDPESFEQLAARMRIELGTGDEVVEQILREAELASARARRAAWERIAASHGEEFADLTTGPFGRPAPVPDSDDSRFGPYALQRYARRPPEGGGAPGGATGGRGGPPRGGSLDGTGGGPPLGWPRLPREDTPGWRDWLTWVLSERQKRAWQEAGTPAKQMEVVSDVLAKGGLSAEDRAALLILQRAIGNRIRLGGSIS